MDFPRVNIKPEPVDVDAPPALTLSHEGIARHVLHLDQDVDHGQLVRHAELLVHIDIGGELGLLVELVEEQGPAEVSCLQPEELVDGSAAVLRDPVTERREVFRRDICGVCVDVVQHVDSLAVAVAADDDVFNIV